jgi:hypothetical protein
MSGLTAPLGDHDAWRADPRKPSKVRGHKQRGLANRDRRPTELADPHMGRLRQRPVAPECWHGLPYLEPVIGGTLSLNALEQVSNASAETSATPPPR